MGRVLTAAVLAAGAVAVASLGAGAGQAADPAPATVDDFQLTDHTRLAHRLYYFGYAPAIVLTQHIPGGFSRAFVERLDRHSPMLVREAGDGEQILPGHAYLPPGDRHLRIIRDGARWRCRIDDGPPVNRHRPAVDVLFRSVAQNAGANAVAAILTGMGDDGARGLLELRQAGAATLVQDEATSVVWGMPGAAWKLGAAQEMLPLDRIAGRLLELSGARVAA